MYQREVEIAVGFNDGTWKSVIVTVPESEDRALDDDEVKEAATEIAEALDLGGQAVSFRTVLHISPPEGGYSED